MKIDLTAITTPFGLLDDATREALKAHGGPYEVWFQDPSRWEEWESPSWSNSIVYRVKPSPPKPREWWLRMDSKGRICGTDPVEGDPPPNWNMEAVIRVREVTD